MKIFISISLTFFSTLGICYTSDCKIEQPHITLGEYFTKSSNFSNYFTVSAIIRGVNCDPKLEIKRVIGKDVILPPDEKRPYNLPDIGYESTSYFFSIPKSLSSNLNTWKVKTITDSSYEVYMPSQGSLSPPGEANIAIVADMDVSLISLPLLELMQNWDQSTFDFMLHVGNFAYMIEDNSGKKGDEYFEEMSKRATMKIPYVVTPGNHDMKDTGKLFNYRFRMPGGGDYTDRAAHYFSFRYKGVHYVTVNSDLIFFHRPELKIDVLNWLRNELETASKDPEVNFIVFYSHRPFYCPIFIGDHCKIFYHWRPFEIMLRKYKVDMYLLAHAHFIFRLKKQQDFVNFEGEEAEKLPLMVVAGACGSLPHKVKKNRQAMTDYEYFGESAYLRLKTNKLKISGEFVQSRTGEILDSFEIKNRRTSLKYNK